MSIGRRTLLLGALGLVGAGAAVRAALPLVVPRGDHALPLDFATIWEYADRAHMAYQSDARIRAYYPAGRLRIFGDERVHTKVVLHRPPGARHQWLAIRGTQTLDDVFHDLLIGETVHPRFGVAVHRGFADIAEDIVEQVIPELEAGLPVRVAGHSLGGAVGVLVMMELDHRGVPLDWGLTFGQPKLTTAAGVARYGHLPLLRVVNGRDPIPHMPPSSVVLDDHGAYAHLGTELWLDGEDWAHFAAHQAARVELGQDWATLVYARPGDHLLPAGYMDTLNQQLPPAVRKAPG